MRIRVSSDMFTDRNGSACSQLNHTVIFSPIFIFVQDLSKVVAVDNPDWNGYCSKLSDMLKSKGGQIPAQVRLILITSIYFNFISAEGVIYEELIMFGYICF